MKRQVLNSVLPFVKEYAAGRGEHEDQPIHRPDIYKGNAVGAIVGSGGITRLGRSSTFCYDGLNHGLNVQNPQAILLQLQPCPDDLDVEAYRHYIQWVLNYSPWRNIFVTKSINYALKIGVVVVDPTSQKNTMIDGMIALRQAWDNYANLPRYPQIGLWWELVQKVDPLYALGIVSNILYLKSKDKIAEGIIHTGHSPIGNGSDYPNSIDNFVLGNLKDNSPPWNTSRSGSAWAIWDHSHHEVKPKIRDLIHTALASIGQDKAKVNVFKSYDTNKVYDRAVVIDCLINEIPNMEKEIGV